MNVYRQYIDAVEPYYPLMSMYGDSSVVFYKTKYITNQKPFVPRIQGNNYPALKDCLAQDIKTGNMLSVFRRVKIDKSKYRLLLEEVPENTEALDWYEVTETWGYTPDTRFETAIITAWTRPAFKIGLEQNISKPILSSTVNADNTATLSCNNSDGRIVAETFINLRSGEYQDGESEANVYTQAAENVIVRSATADSIVVEPFIWQVYDLDGKGVSTVQSFAEGSAFKRSGVSIIAQVEVKGKEMGLRSTDSNNKTHVVNVDSSDGGIQDGDIVKFYKMYYAEYGRWFYAQDSDFVQVLKATEDSIIVPFFYWNVRQDNTDTPYKIYSDSTEGGFYAPGAKYVSLMGEQRSEWAADFAGRQVIDYVSTLEPENAWAPKAGGDIVNYVSYYTDPTLEEYQQMISRGDMVLAQPQVYELFIGDIYKRTSVYIKCQ